MIWLFLAGLVREGDRIKYRLTRFGKPVFVITGLRDETEPCERFKYFYGSASAVPDPSTAGPPFAAVVFAQAQQASELLMSEWFHHEFGHISTLVLGPAIV